MSRRPPRLRTLMRRCRAVTDTLTLPDPFDVGELCRAVGERRGRPIVLAPLTTTGGPCGLWLKTADLDFIFHETGTSALHQNHIVLHELGHVLLDQHQAESLDDEMIRQLFPDLDPAAVRSALGRTRYTAVEEQEAEVFAHLVLARVRPVERVPEAEGPIGDVLRALATGLPGA